MRRNLIIVIIVAMLACAYLIAWRSIARETISDEASIGNLIALGERAVEQRDLGDTMACVSRDYEDGNGLTYPALRARSAQALQSVHDVEIKGKVFGLTVNGDKAIVVYGVDVVLDGEKAFHGSLDLIMKKEPTWRHWIFRVKEWKIVAVEGYPSAFE